MDHWNLWFIFINCIRSTLGAKSSIYYVKCPNFFIVDWSFLSTFPINCWSFITTTKNSLCRSVRRPDTQSCHSDVKTMRRSIMSPSGLQRELNTDINTTLFQLVLKVNIFYKYYFENLLSGIKLEFPPRFWIFMK